MHRHLKAHGITQVQYYQRYFPRYDKLDGSIIKFKNREYYLTADFNSRANLATWLKKVEKREARDYIIGFLKARKERKNLRFAPTQVELRSLPIPGMSYLNELFGGYYDLCKGLGYELRFDKMGWSGPAKPFLKSHHILCDTREQLPLSFRINRYYEALNFGDYRLSDDSFTHNCCIERKAMGDFYSTLSHGYMRFSKELERSDEAGFYLVVLVESPFESVYTFSNVLRHVNVNISPEYVLHNVRQFCQNFRNLQFLFVKDREEASRAIERVFQSDGEYRRLDLQYLYDTKKLF
jgi:hypothetical protein